MYVLSIRSVRFEFYFLVIVIGRNYLYCPGLACRHRDACSLAGFSKGGGLTMHFIRAGSGFQRLLRLILNDLFVDYGSFICNLTCPTAVTESGNYYLLHND